VDASLDAEVYLALARERGWTIRHVLDTHIHADHLSRSRDLARRAGAGHLLPETRRARFPHRALADEEVVAFGRASLLAMRTPGHTPESTCYLVDRRWLLTGDTLFPSAVGRPDLEADAEEARARALRLHGSLHRLLSLEAALLVLPGHADRPVPFDRALVAATLGDVRTAIHLPDDPGVFVAHVLGRLPPTPPNHGVIVAANEAGELPAIDAAELEAGANRCAVS